MTIGDPLSPTLPKHPPKTPQKKSKGIFFGNYFRVQNSGKYKLLLSSCLRCGKKRICHDGRTYERIWADRQHPQRCDGWISQGFIQIWFAERKLPTAAVVAIQPKHSKIGWGRFGQTASFAVKSTAYPINESKGFTITLSQNQGLGGGYPLKVESRDTNHVKKSSLFVEVEYGPPSGGASTIISEELKLMKQRAVAPPRTTCRQCVHWR